MFCGEARVAPSRLHQEPTLPPPWQRLCGGFGAQRHSLRYVLRRGPSGAEPPASGAYPTASLAEALWRFWSAATFFKICSAARPEWRRAACIRSLPYRLLGRGSVAVLERSDIL